MADWLAYIALSSQVSAPAPGSSKFIAGVLLDLNQLLVEPVSQFASLITDGVDELAGFLHKVNQGRTDANVLDSLMKDLPLSPSPTERGASPLPRATPASRHHVLPLAQPTVHPLPHSPTKSQVKPLPLRQVHGAASLGTATLAPNHQSLRQNPVSPTRSTNHGGDTEDSFEVVLGAARQSLADKQRQRRLPTSPMRLPFKPKSSNQSLTTPDLDQLSPIRLPKTLFGFGSKNKLSKQLLTSTSPIRQTVTAPTPVTQSSVPASKAREVLLQPITKSQQEALRRPQPVQPPPVVPSLPQPKPHEKERDVPSGKTEVQPNSNSKQARDPPKPSVSPPAHTTPAKPITKSDDVAVISPVDTTKIRAEFRAQSHTMAVNLLQKPTSFSPTKKPRETPTVTAQNTPHIPPRKLPSSLALSSSPKHQGFRVTKPRTNESRNRLLTATLNSSPNRLPREWKTPRRDPVRVQNVPKIPTTPKITKLPLLNPRVISSEKPRHRGNAVPLPKEARGIVRPHRTDDPSAPPPKRPAVASSLANGSGTNSTVPTSVPASGPNPPPSGPTSGSHRSLSQQGVSRGVSDAKKSSGAFVPIWRQLKDKTLGAPSRSLPTAGTVGTPDTLPQISSSPEQGGDKSGKSSHRVYEKWAASPELRRRVKDNRNKDPTQFFIPPQHYDWGAVFENSLSKWRARVSPYSSPLKRDIDREVKSYAEQMGYR